MTHISLSQQKVNTLQDALEQEMQIEAMVGYPQDCRVGGPSTDPAIMGLQNQISTLTERLKYLAPLHPMRPHVWCTHCQVEGHHVTECPRLRGLGPCSV
jgi:hypothetical protein